MQQQGRDGMPRSVPGHRSRSVTEPEPSVAETLGEDRKGCFWQRFCFSDQSVRDSAGRVVESVGRWRSEPVWQAAEDGPAGGRSHSSTGGSVPLQSVGSGQLGLLCGRLKAIVASLSSLMAVELH